jgi:glutathione-regulated potassium-efflux system ancillary protein KefG
MNTPMTGYDVKNILVLFFHPRFEESRANRLLASAATSTQAVTFRDMYELYPDFNIDVAAEKECLLQHDVIVLQHPFFWYNCPPLMKQWIDLVLEYGWAYGKGGDKLAGKQVLQVITSAGTFDVYRPEGRNRFTYRTLLSSFDQTMHLCQMHYLPPFIVPGAPRLTREQLGDYAQQYQRILLGLQRGTWTPEQLGSAEYFNQIID